MLSPWRKRLHESKYVGCLHKSFYGGVKIFLFSSLCYIISAFALELAAPLTRWFDPKFLLVSRLDLSWADENFGAYDFVPRVTAITAVGMFLWMWRGIAVMVLWLVPAICIVTVPMVKANNMAVGNVGLFGIIAAANTLIPILFVTAIIFRFSGARIDSISCQIGLRDIWLLMTLLCILLAYLAVVP